MPAALRRRPHPPVGWGSALPPWSWNLSVIAVVLLVAAPEYILAHRLDLAFEHTLARLLQQTNGNIPPGAIPASDFALILLAFLLEIATLKWAHAGVARALGETGRLPLLSLLCLWGAIAFATGIAPGLAGVLIGVFALVLLFELFSSTGGRHADPGDGLHGPRATGR